MADRKLKPEIACEVRDGRWRMSQIRRERSLYDSLLRPWFEQYRERGPDAFLGADPQSDELVAAQKRIAELEAALGRAALEVDYLRRCVKRANIPLPDGAGW